MVQPVLVSLPIMIDEVMLRLSFVELQACSWVCILWRDAPRRHAPQALIDACPRALMRLIGWAPPEARVNRIINRAMLDQDFMNMIEFRTVVEVQLVLQYVRRALVYPHSLPLREVVDLLAQSVARGLSTEHPVVRHALALLEITGVQLSLDVGDYIPRMQLIWRHSTMDRACIGSVLHSLVIGLSGIDDLWQHIVGNVNVGRS